MSKRVAGPAPCQKSVKCCSSKREGGAALAAPPSKLPCLYQGPSPYLGPCALIQHRIQLRTLALKAVQNQSVCAYMTV